MAPVTVSYMKAGTKPPIYLAGSFSDWEVQEMEYEIPEGQEELRFYKTIQAEEGKEFQYKFRIGEGDWWVLDEEAPVVTDNLGNRNNLLAIPKPTTTNMSDQVNEGSPEGPAAVQSPQAASEKDMIEKDSQSSELAHKKQTDAEDTSEDKKESETAGQDHANTSPSSATNDAIPTLVVEKTDDSPSYGEDFGPAATFAEKEAHAMRLADAEPDSVVIQPDTPANGQAETIAEVSESAALVDERAKTPEISDEEAGKIGLRRMSSTPIPEVANTAAEVAESAAGLDHEESSTPDLTDKEAGQIGLRRLSMTPISVVAETAAEVAATAASLDQATMNIEIPPRSSFDDFGDDDGRSYPATPENEKAPLFSHEKFIPSGNVSPPQSPEGAADTSPAITPWEERAPLFSHERYIEPGSSSSPRREDAIPTPEADRPYPMQFDLQEFPTSREGIMALIDQTQRDLPEDEVRLSPNSPRSPSHMFSRPDVLTPGASPRSEHSRSPMGEPRSTSLGSIAEENDSAAVEDAETSREGQAAEIEEEGGNLTATEYSQISKLVENPAEPEKTLKSLKSRDQFSKEETEEKHNEKTTAALDKASNEASEEVVVEAMVLPESEPKIVPLGRPQGSSDQELEKEFVGEVIKESDETGGIKQMDGNMASEQMTPAEPTLEIVEVVDDAVSDDSPRTTPPTSSEGSQSYFASTSAPRDATETPSSNGPTDEPKAAKLAVKNLEAPAIVVQPATPAATTFPVADPISKEAVLDEADEEARIPEPETTPMPEESKTTSVAESNSNSPSVPDEVKSHVHSPQEDTADAARTVSRDTDATKFAEADTTTATESVVTQRKLGNSSTERSESQDSTHSNSPLVPGREEHPGLLKMIYAAVIGWIGGIFSKLFGGKDGKKGKKTSGAGGNFKRV